MPPCLHLISYIFTETPVLPQTPYPHQWHKQPGATDCDGFEIKRKGDTDTPARIFIHLDNSPDKFKLSPDLAQVLDIHTDTKPNVIMALWQYIKTYKLQDPEDKRAVNCNEALLKVRKCFERAGLMGCCVFTFTLSLSLCRSLATPSSCLLKSQNC